MLDYRLRREDDDDIPLPPDHNIPEPIKEPPIPPKSEPDAPVREPGPAPARRL
jgi:hypothetical protein